MSKKKLFKHQMANETGSFLIKIMDLLAQDSQSYNLTQQIASQTQKLQKSYRLNFGSCNKLRLCKKCNALMLSSKKTYAYVSLKPETNQVEIQCANCSHYRRFPEAVYKKFALEISTTNET